MAANAKKKAPSVTQKKGRPAAREKSPRGGDFFSCHRPGPFPCHRGGLFFASAAPAPPPIAARAPETALPAPSPSRPHVFPISPGDRLRGALNRLLGASLRSPAAPRMRAQAPPGPFFPMSRSGPGPEAAFPFPPRPFFSRRGLLFFLPRGPRPDHRHHHHALGPQCGKGRGRDGYPRGVCRRGRAAGKPRKRPGIPEDPGERARKAPEKEGKGREKGEDTPKGYSRREGGEAARPAELRWGIGGEKGPAMPGKGPEEGGGPGGMPLWGI